MDASSDALRIARANAIAHGLADRIRFVGGNGFGALGEPASGFDLIVSNPPYIPLAEIEGLAREVRDHDPRRALDGGPDGLDAYRRIAAGAPGHLAPGGHVLVEIGAGQEEAVTGIFRGQGFGTPARHLDLGGHVRCLVFPAA